MLPALLARAPLASVLAVLAAASSFACTKLGGGGALGAGSPATSVSTSPSAAPGSASAPTTCAPSLQGKPAFAPPAGYPRAECTSAEIAALFTSCFGASATVADCDAAKAAHARCLACIDTPEGADAGGPVFVANGGVFVDYAGCVALLDPDGGATCARALGEQIDCEIRSCAAGCAGAATSSLDRCIDEARAANGPCGPRATAADTACGAEKDPRVLSTCAVAATDTFVSSGVRVAGVFCGGLDADGGAAADAGP